jgi:hypothetical protein
MILSHIFGKRVKPLHLEITETFFTTGFFKDSNVDSITFWNQKEDCKFNLIS